MAYLIIVSLIWAFSFGLIKGNLTGINPNLVAFLRLLLSGIVFLPFINFKNISYKTAFKLVFTGAVQYGMMYSAYIYSYQFLKAYEVALFTIFTPLYVTIIADLLNKRFNKHALIASIITVIGTGIILISELSSEIYTGFFLIQFANLCFAFGQIFYKHIMKAEEITNDKNVFGLLYAGAVIITLLPLFTVENIAITNITLKQWLTLLYLGIISSGLCFFLWNKGARKTDQGTLAIFNNLKVPLGIFVSLIFFGEETNLIKLFAGGSIIVLAFIYNKYKAATSP